MRKILKLAMGILFLLTVFSTFAQSGKKIVTPVTVTVEKAAVTPGNAVKITGTSVQLGDKNTVKIVITKPDATTVSVSSRLTSQGTYNAQFKETKIAGAYKVTAYSPDDKNSAKTSFQVVTAGYIDEMSKKRNQSIVQLTSKTDKIVKAVKTTIETGEDFPGREKINKDIAKIDQELVQLPKQMAKMNKAIDQLSEMTKQYPGLVNVGELAEVAQALDEEREKADEMAAQADELLSRMSKSQGMSICDRMDAAVSALQFVGLVFDIAINGPAKVSKILFNMAVPVAIDKIYEIAVPLEKRSVTNKTVFGTTVKNIVTLHKDGYEDVKKYAKEPMGLAYDAAGYLVELGFEHLCERFTGPLEGVLSVDAKDAGGRPFWRYKIYIKGRLILRYEKKKNTGNAPVPLTGAFEGAATKFEAWEDFLGRLDDLNTVLFHCVVPPIAAGEPINWMAETFLGQMGSAVTLPYYFLIPVTGALSADGSSVTIKVAETGTMDFKKDLSASAFYASIPKGSIIPIVQQFDIPMQNAQFILSRGLRSPATVKVKTEKSKVALIKTINQTFKREEVVSNGEVTVKWELKVKACNPDCP